MKEVLVVAVAVVALYGFLSYVVAVVAIAVAVDTITANNYGTYKVVGESRQPFCYVTANYEYTFLFHIDHKPLSIIFDY